MGETRQNDVLVYFQQEGQSKAIAAESQSVLDSGDEFTTDFAVGRFFATDTFGIGITLTDDEGDNPLTPENEGRSYARWRVLKIGNPKPTPPFQAEPEDISLTRAIDSSSPILLGHCLQLKPFDRVVIAKRARIGTTGLFSTVLRLEFTRVWIKAIEWEDSDAVKEVIKFKYNAVTGTFVRRKPDGTVASRWPFSWKSMQKVA